MNSKVFMENNAPTMPTFDRPFWHCVFQLGSRKCLVGPLAKTVGLRIY